ncbi:MULTISPECIES: acyl-CoA dehydrogenase family protein [unclassified Chelatococcus]|uniref:acyl-CoA dehydrogenase family protein n=1 Tax=unclassified Chelatococcus TaxID=2638111 RepID=UPI001BD0AB78|nr:MULTISPECIES: acyl-CoA dehydrogenase family protein [unclassified Chelatococcus]MBS7743442.1 acyl-CoA/acyl-ACP dehydrogenase [Chelatococcus sp. HY11]MBX3547181.1 acyl-CoA/acyl-ACP dehydrogenase [Chelatococcus sp.]CAH1663804.1 Acyl-CoA dehydrogenase [Hyphomicrobiales bacterium]CAH1687909.1 Acyl-CoA dehydrogenase [Hyphomicrobiales bacterium]
MDFDLTDEQLAFRESVRRWVDKEASKSWARELEKNEHEYPFALWDKFTEAEFHGIGIPEEYGGQGGDIVMQMIFARELARTLGGMLWVWGLTSFAGGKSIGVYGSDEQKKRFLPDIAAGKLRVSIAFTEPGGGTDVLGALRTNGKRVEGGWVLTGEKMWSSASQVADYLLTLVRTDSNVEKRHHGLSVFFVPAKQKGITITPVTKLGMRSIGSCIVHFDNVFVPDELVLGEPGKAWYTLLPTLNNERTMVGAQCLGAIDGILEDALDYAKQRHAFGRPIGSFQAIQHYIANIACWQKEVELLLYYTASLQAQNKPCGNEANMLKMMATERAVEAADLGIQILGGMGYSAETDMQRYWRDHRILRMTPISNEMVRNTLAENLGLPRSF